ncbi:hypothetical protein ACU686_15330 [Yinghuangia aomiensis]
MAEPHPATARRAPGPVRLRRELTAESGRLAWALLLAVAAAGATLALPLLVREIITDFSRHRPLGADVALMCVAAVGSALWRKPSPASSSHASANAWPTGCGCGSWTTRCDFRLPSCARKAPATSPPGSPPTRCCCAKSST